MRIAYLILAHNTPNHLQRLITALATPSSSFFIHLDAKSDANDFRHIKGDNILFAHDRVPVYWGDFSQVEAALILLRNAVAIPQCFDRFVLLSGSDYPLRSTKYIERFFAGNIETEFINLVKMPSNIVNKPISRLTRFKFNPVGRTAAIVPSKLLLAVGRLFVYRNYKKVLKNMTPYGGSTWWALSYQASCYILDFAKHNPAFIDFFKNTFNPDESFFQTILGNSRFQSAIVRNLSYTDWNKGGGSPAYITEDHIALFRAQSPLTLDDVYGRGEALFARKFRNNSALLVSMLDALIQRREQTESEPS
jgi:hypothetical protein